MYSFKKLKVWEKAHLVVLEVYRVSAEFPKHELYGITSQLRRASVSIPTNLAEGSGKLAQKDMANYFQIGLGSCHETEYLLLLSHDLKYLSQTDFEKINNQINEIKAMLIGLIKKVRSS